MNEDKKKVEVKEIINIVIKFVIKVINGISIRRYTKVVIIK